MSLFDSYLSQLFPEVGPLDFYRELFPSGELERRGEYVDGEYCGIAVQVVGKNKAKRYSVTDDLEVIEKLIETDDFCIMSPVSYAGKSQRQEFARFLYAVTFDLDGVIVRDGDPEGLRALLHQMESHTALKGNGAFLPMPTYIVSSGTGLHLYYLLERPVPMFKNVIKQMANLRRELTRKIWNMYVTKLSGNVQYESVTQGFRMVGSMTKDQKDRVRAYRVGAKVSMDYLNSFVDDPSMRVNDYSYKSSLSLNRAKELYPDWYQSRIIEGNPRGTWTVKRDLYDWWKRKMLSGAVVGHRYFCVMALAIFARKCAIGRDELESDALSMVDILDRLSPEDGSNSFGADDVAKALEAYDASYQTFPRKSIEDLTAIPMPPNKRNGRKQALHLRMARSNLAILSSDAGHALQGRPSKADEIRAYAAANPGQSNSAIARALGVSRTTVVKWLKG